MEENLQTKAREHKIDPPGESHYSLVLNGATNGGTVAGLPFLLMNLYDEVIRKAEAPSISHATRNKVGIALTAVGCVIGGYFGYREAERLQKYRYAVSDEIATLRAEVNDNSKALNSWLEKEKAREAAPAAEPEKTR